MDEGESIQDLSAYFYGVARLLFKETLRRHDKEPITLDLAPELPIATEDEELELRRQEEDRRLGCFETCLSKLPAASRVLIVEYYREEKGVKIERRKLQATALNISLNALRLRACRIRTELGDCINTCVSHSKGDTETSISH